MAPPPKKSRTQKTPGPSAKDESTPMAPPTNKKQTPKAAPTKTKQSTPIDPPATKKQTPTNPSAKMESTPIDHRPSKKKATPKAPAAKKEPTSKSPAKKKSTPMTPAASKKELTPAASSSTAGPSTWICPTQPLTEAQIQRTLVQLQQETLHSYKCKEKKLKDLKAMNEMITQYPHRLEQPNAFLNNRGRTSLGFMDEMPDLITPLADAACRGHLKCAEILLSHGANVNAISSGGRGRGITILEAFMLWSEIPNHLDMLSLLVSNGASPLPEDNNGRDLLYEAVRLGEFETVKFLLEHGLDVEHLDLDGNLMYPSKTPPLQKAFYSFSFDIVKLLLLYNATLTRNAWRCGKEEEKFTVPELLVNIINTSVTDLWYYIDKDKQAIAIEKAPQRLLMSLRIYHIFGGKLGSILDYLDTLQKGDMLDSVRAELQELVNSPMSLKSMARLVVKKCLGKNYLKNIKNLAVNGLPDEVEQFLRFEDVVTEC